MPGSRLHNLWPSPLITLAYATAALLVLFIATTGSWLNRFFNPAVSANLFGLIGQRYQELLQLTQGESLGGLGATIATLVFWLCVGAALYMVLWLVFAVIHGLINEIELSLLFVHPRSFKESKHWLAYLSRIGLRIAAAAVTIGYGVLLVNVVWPAVVIQFAYGLLTFTPWSILTHVLGAVATLMVAMHLLFLLMQVVLWKRA